MVKDASGAKLKDHIFIASLSNGNIKGAPMQRQLFQHWFSLQHIFLICFMFIKSILLLLGRYSCNELFAFFSTTNWALFPLTVGLYRFISECIQNPVFPCHAAFGGQISKYSSQLIKRLLPSIMCTTPSSCNYRNDKKASTIYV